MARPQSAGAFYASALAILGLGFVGAIILAGFLFNELGKTKQARDKAVSDLKLHFDPAVDPNDPIYSVESKHTEKGKTTVARLMLEIAELRSKSSLAKTNNDQAEAGIKNLEDKLRQANDKYEQIVAESQGVHKSDAEKVDKALLRVKEVEQLLASARANADAQSADASQKLKALAETIEQSIAEWRAKYDGSQQSLAESEKLASTCKSRITELLRIIQVGKIPQLNDVATTDAVISQMLPNNEISFNIGKNQGVRPGMTFEAFPADTVVHVEAGIAAHGKATYEVYRVDETSSVARLVRISTGAHINKGDSLVNIAFDATRQISFVVWGKFDLERVNDPRREVEDSDRVKALVGVMGGRVAELRFVGEGEDEHVILDPNVDYVVVGKAVEYPSDLSAEEKLDPVKVEGHRDAMRQYKIYQDVIDQAKRMQIPVCNQNRFVELSGFYTR